MSLMVYLLSKDKSIDTNELEKQIPEPFDFLFGVEVCRKELWGKEVMKELGCHMIYSLKDGDIYAFDEELQELKVELNIILNNIDIFEEKSTDGYGYVEFRVKNALEAIKVAEKYKDVGVYIG
jgi:hypothetical protein